MCVFAIYVSRTSTHYSRLPSPPPHRPLIVSCKRTKVIHYSAVCLYQKRLMAACGPGAVRRNLFYEYAPTANFSFRRLDVIILFVPHFFFFFSVYIHTPPPLPLSHCSVCPLANASLRPSLMPRKSSAADNPSPSPSSAVHPARRHATSGRKQKKKK